MADAENAVVAEPTTATPTTKSKTLKAAVDAVFEAAKVALRYRPIALAVVIAADAAIDAVWDKISPPAQKMLASKGVEL